MHPVLGEGALIMLPMALVMAHPRLDQLAPRPLHHQLALACLQRRLQPPVLPHQLWLLPQSMCQLARPAVPPELPEAAPPTVVAVVAGTQAAAVAGAPGPSRRRERRHLGAPTAHCKRHWRPRPRRRWVPNRQHLPPPLPSRSRSPLALRTPPRTHLGAPRAITITPRVAVLQLRQIMAPTALHPPAPLSPRPHHLPAAATRWWQFRHSPRLSHQRWRRW